MFRVKVKVQAKGATATVWYLGQNESETHRTYGPTYLTTRKDARKFDTTKEAIEFVSQLMTDKLTREEENMMRHMVELSITRR